MKTTYVCTYFNYHEDPIRRQLTQEFCDRYPWVTLLQASFKPQPDIRSDNTVVFPETQEGFLIFKLINRYLRENQVENLVLIDSDVILEDDCSKNGGCFENK